MASAAHKVEIRREKRETGFVAHVVFDNSRRLNVVNPAGLQDLIAAFHTLSLDADLRAVVFSGHGGKAFIGGADINHMAGMRTSEDGRAFITLIHELCQAIRDCPVPVICKLEGYTLGGGLEDVADFGKDVLGFFVSLPGPVKKTAIELGVAYGALRLLKSTFATGAPAVQQFTANMQNGQLVLEKTATTAQKVGVGLRNVAGAGGMLLVADSTTRASRELATFEGALGGALTGFAASGGNPIGAVVGGLVGGLIPALKGSGDAAKVAEPEFQSYADSLNQTSGAVTKLTKELLLQDLQKNKVLDTTRALGLTDKQVLAGVSKEGPARDRLVTSLKGQVEAANATFKSQVLAARAEGLSGTALVARIGKLDEARRATTDDAGAILKQIGALDKQTVQLLENKNTLSQNKTEARAAREALRNYARTNGTAKINLAGAGFVKDALRSIREAANNLDGAQVRLKITASTNANLAELKVLGGKREFGGSVRAGVPYVVGERRPEVFVPQQSGRIEPDVGRYMSSVPQEQAAQPSFTYAPQFFGPTTGRERLREMEWTQRYATSARSEGMVTVRA